HIWLKQTNNSRYMRENRQLILCESAGSGESRMP
ncbi:MAG: hypothetical protein ACI9XU_001881, partial [Arenicella sp.]